MSLHGDPMFLIHGNSFWHDGCAKAARQPGESLRSKRPCCPQISRRFPVRFHCEGKTLPRVPLTIYVKGRTTGITQTNQGELNSAGEPERRKGMNQILVNLTAFDMTCDLFGMVAHKHEEQVHRHLFEQVFQTCKAGLEAYGLHNHGTHQQPQTKETRHEPATAK